jgi:UDP-3-O-acyl-N-acetylglucosamine deacetylase
VEALTKACIVEQNRLKKRLALSRAVEVRSGEASLAAMPSEEGLHVQYTLDYGGRFLPRQTIEVEVTEETFVRQIAPARSYVLRPEIEVFLRQGLGGGATPENTLVVEEDGAIATKLRFPDECIRHKVLDLLGDLQVLGGRLVADLVGHRSGHRLNVELARKIARAFASNV